MPFNVLTNKGCVASGQVYAMLPTVFHSYIKDLEHDDVALTTICVLYSHIMDEDCQLSTLQEYCNACGVSRNTLIAVFYKLKESELLIRHFATRNKYEGHSFNEKIIKELNIDTSTGKHIIFFKLPGKNIDIKYWVDTPKYIKGLNIQAPSLNFYHFTNQLITQLLRHPIDREAFPFTRATGKNALKILSTMTLSGL